MDYSKLFSGSKKILFVHHLLTMGDAVFLSSVFRAIKHHNPDMAISVLTKEYSTEFLKNFPSVDRVINLSQYVPEHPVSKAVKIRALVKLVLLMRRYDAVVLRKDARVPLTKLFNWASRMSGCRGVLHMKGFLEKHLSSRKHIIDVYGEILKELGLRIEEPMKSDVFVTEAGESFAWKMLSENSLLEKPIVGVCPVSGVRIKSISPRTIAGVLNDKMFKDAGIILFSMDDEWNRALRPHLQHSAVVVGRLPFEFLVSVISKCRVFLSADTGPMHIAAALGIPTLGIFGPTSGVITGPYGPKTAFIQASQTCEYFNPISPYAPGTPLQRCYIEDRCFLDGNRCIDSLHQKDILQRLKDFLFEENVRLI